MRRMRVLRQIAREHAVDTLAAVPSFATLEQEVDAVARVYVGLEREYTAADRLHSSV